jgi:hypothetical protein
MGGVIALVLRQSPTYSTDWVGAMLYGLRSHGYTGRVVCLSDVHVSYPVEVVPLRKDWPGWWSKLELFRPGLFTEPVLYLDLDTLVVGNVSKLLAIRSPLAMLSDFYRPTLAASGVMAWMPGETSAKIYDLALRGIPGRGRMDVWLDSHGITADRVQDMAEGVYSYKAHARAKAPDDAVLVCGHGNPRFTSPAAGWAHELWTRNLEASHELRT